MSNLDSDAEHEAATGSRMPLLGRFPFERGTTGGTPVRDERGTATASSAEGSTGTRTTSRAVEIFVIEDDENIREAIDAILSYEGYVVRSWSNGIDALASIDAGARPDLIVLDLMMPKMDGWQFRVEQRARPLVADVPVLVLSANGSSKAAAIDADAFMRKPFGFAHFRAAVARLLTEADRRRLGAQQHETERLRALGTLVAGVAHEINNPLTYVCGSLDLIDRGFRSMLGDGGIPANTADSLRLAKAIANARTGTERIASFVRTLSRFAHIETETAEEVDLHAMLDGVAALATVVLSGRAVLVKRYGNVQTILGSEARLGQVFLNLLVNAAQSIPVADAAHGVVSITTGTTEKGTFVEVSDNGSGMSDELATRVFEPFFTTKAPGEGTGLGLSISHDIVSAHGGVLCVRSIMGIGTTFRVDLPAHVVIPEPEAFPAVESGDAGESGERRRPLGATIQTRVLGVEDAPMIRDLGPRVLARRER